MVLLNLLTLQRFETGSSCGLNNREVRARWERDLFQGREISLTGHKPEIDLGKLGIRVVHLCEILVDSNSICTFEILAIRFC